MKVYSAAETEQRLEHSAVIDALHNTWSQSTRPTCPTRTAHTQQRGDEEDSILLLMPCWQTSAVSGVKIVNVVPGNADRDLSSIQSSYLTFDGVTGAPTAVMDGNTLTAVRTACVGALGARLLARQDSRVLLVIGTGAVGSQLPLAYTAALPSLEVVYVASGRVAKAEALVALLVEKGMDARVVGDGEGDLEAAVNEADIISCATPATAPLFPRSWVSPGTHIDLIGSFTPEMREVDDQTVADADVYIDTPVALEEAGELVQALASGAIQDSHIKGDLASLCSAPVPPSHSRDPSGITLFKAVGSGVSDLACARLVLHQSS